MLRKKITDKSSKYSLAIDLGTAGLTGAVFQMGDTLVQPLPLSDKPKILEIYHRYNEPTLNRDVRRFQKNMLHHLSELFRMIDRDYSDTCMKNIFLGFSSPFYMAHTVEVVDSFEEERKITQKDIDLLYQKGQDKINSRGDKSKMSIFETVIMKKELNGYAVDALINKRASNITIALRYAAANSVLFSEINKRISQLRCTPRISYYTFPTLYSLMMRSIGRTAGASVLIDIGGDITEITILKDGIIDHIFTAPIGMIGIYERVSETLHVDYLDAVTIINSYVNDTLDSGRHIAVSEIIHEIFKSWSDFMNHAIGYALETPHSRLAIFFLGGGSVIKELKSLFYTLPVMEKIKNSVRISNISTDAFKDKVTSLKPIRGPKDFGVMSLILFSKQESQNV